MTATDNETVKTSPMMAQWHSCKASAGEALLLFRMGDFYEAFYDDAVLLSKELDIALTKRQEIPMAGIPHHSAENYIDRLVQKKIRVAIAEQLEDPKTTKGIVKRDIVRFVTPGTIINSSLLSEKSNNFFASLSEHDKQFGMTVLDISTGELITLELDTMHKLKAELWRFKPKEILAPKRFIQKYQDLFNELKACYCPLVNPHDDWRFEPGAAHDFLLSHLLVKTLEGFGLKETSAAVGSAGALLNYIQDFLRLPIHHIRTIKSFSYEEHMVLDPAAQKNLELSESMRSNSKHTLFGILDNTSTAMGARLLMHWVKHPLLSLEKIQKRQNAIKASLENEKVSKRLESDLTFIKDLERLMMKIVSGFVGPKDLSFLKESLKPLHEIKSLSSHLGQHSEFFLELAENVSVHTELFHLIDSTIVDEPPFRIGDARLFKEGFHKELDELRLIGQDGKKWLSDYQDALRTKTGIKTLKVGYNRMFGYYIEVSKGQAANMPSTFHRRQTLVNAERFITDELKNFEEKVFSANDRIDSLEQELFKQIRLEIAKHKEAILKTAGAIANIDCILSLGATASLHHWKKPTVDTSHTLEIVEGRHPVLDVLQKAERFVPNDTFMDDQKNRLMLITGPNMAGKSTYIRQVALIAILAHIGSYVPAKSARIGLIDRVFTRIGAHDDLSRGQSTFMVEMTETANILNNATDRSLVVLDEIGRGTSTYDGIAIAWSAAEWLLTQEGRRAKTLFATHFFELTKMEELIEGAVNYNVAVHEHKGQVVFLHRILRGGADKSYGIHVAKLAGLPVTVIERSKEILLHLEETGSKRGIFEPTKPKKAERNKTKLDEFQLSFIK